MTKKKITCDEFWTEYELTDGVAGIWSVEQIQGVLDNATKKQARKVLREMKDRVGGNSKDHEYWDAEEGFCADDVQNYFEELLGEDPENGAVPADSGSAE